MTRYRLIDRSARFLPIELESQLISGSFEHALDVPIDTEIDLAHRSERFRNDPAGGPAQPPVSFRSIRRSRFVGRPCIPKPGSGSNLRAAIIASRRTRLSTRSA